MEIIIRCKQPSDCQLFPLKITYVSDALSTSLGIISDSWEFTVGDKTFWVESLELKEAMDILIKRLPASKRLKLGLKEEVLKKEGF